MRRRRRWRRRRRRWAMAQVCDVPQQRWCSERARHPGAIQCVRLILLLPRRPTSPLTPCSAPSPHCLPPLPCSQVRRPEEPPHHQLPLLLRRHAQPAGGCWRVAAAAAAAGEQSGGAAGDQGCCDGAAGGGKVGAGTCQHVSKPLLSPSPPPPTHPHPSPSATATAAGQHRGVPALRPRPHRVHRAQER